MIKILFTHLGDDIQQFWEYLKICHHHSTGHLQEELKLPAKTPGELKRKSSNEN